MPSPLKIGVVTGSRADYGLLYWVLQEIRSHPALELQVFVTGMHLSPEFGETWKIIEKDGFTIDQKIDMLVSGDTPVAVTKSIGLGVIGFGDAFERHQPDVILVLGDRFEILAAVQAALIAGIPVAHIAGGDTTEGAFDESIRHAITKMAHVHFVTNEQAAGRVARMGENPAHIHHVGSPGIDGILRLSFLGRPELTEQLGIEFRRRNLLVTFHPATLDGRPQSDQLQELFDALDHLGEDVGIFFTLPNADTEGRKLAAQIREFASVRPACQVFTSLGQQRYLSLLAEVDAVVGNSSSGLYEAPTLAVPTVNIGDRQKGRLQATSVINSSPAADEISAAIQRAFEFDAKGAVNPYGDGHSARRIAEILSLIGDPTSLLQKPFFEYAPA